MAEDSEGDSSVEKPNDRIKGRHHSDASEEHEARQFRASERAVAAQDFLDFLEKDDIEDCAERARNRGESGTNRDLYVVTEEMNVPNGRKDTNDCKHVL